ncbi:54S ribosomal protein L17 mitochondrial [Ascosphaera pollenicola]|nr:54S ribosomal protein L17 mitochondrial [Ascosphaera pollenicola]
MIEFAVNLLAKQQQQQHDGDAKAVTAMEMLQGTDLVLAGYSYGSMITSSLPSASLILDLFMKAHRDFNGDEWVEKTMRNFMLRLLRADDKPGGLPHHPELASALSVSYLLVSPILPPISSFATLSFFRSSPDLTFTSKNGLTIASETLERKTQNGHRVLAVFGDSDMFCGINKLRTWTTKMKEIDKSRFEEWPIAVELGVCRTCALSGLFNATRPRGYATEAAAATATTSTAASGEQPAPVPPASFSTESTAEGEGVAPLTVGTKTHSIKAGLLLSRTPRITRDLTSFEKAFYLYQRRLNERLALPFTKYFYYKKGTPQDQDYKRKVAERLTAARDIGRYSAYGKDAWNDELLVGAPESEPAHQIEALVKDAQKSDSTVAENEGLNTANEEDDEVPRPLSRVTEADLKKDYRSLDRELQRTVYLVFKVMKGEREFWHLPSVDIAPGETLKAGAERALTTWVGPNVNTWIVGNHPVGHYIYTMRNPKARRAALEAGEKIGYKEFFLKGRILAGQVDLALAQQNLGITDYRWLTKEELGQLVGVGYWANIKNMLADR